MKHDCSYYVYAWYALNENLPFYIGKGKGNRAYRDSHIVRNTVIIRDGLRELTAIVLEEILIDVFYYDLNAPLINKNVDARSQSDYEHDSLRDALIDSSNNVDDDLLRFADLIEKDKGYPTPVRGYSPQRDLGSFI